jgi:hypothetical protein
MLFNSFVFCIKANYLKNTLYNKPYMILITSRLPSYFLVSKDENELQIYILTNDTNIVSLIINYFQRINNKRIYEIL